MKKRSTLSLVVIGVLAFAPRAAAQATPEPNDYSDREAWLCRPGGQDACAIDHSTTVVSADGSLTRETWAADPEAPIDCFYVYPTVSTDPEMNSDMQPDPAELNVIAQQFARFAAECRPYAPMYRQMTLAGLRARRSGAGGEPSTLNYDDVVDAWRHYLEHDNDGRGFVLIGHSQGASLLRELIRQEIDGKPIQSRLVSAMLIGTTVPVGRDGTGGTYQSIPLCRSASQLGCLVAYASYRSDMPPPENALFGRVTEPGLVGACTNPAELRGGTSMLHAYLSTSGRTITGTTAPAPWVLPEKRIDTPWVSVPGLLSARCTSNEHATYLEVTVNGDPADPRTDAIIGDIGSGDRIARDWGLHLVDINIAMGDLVEIVSQQAAAYTARQ